MDNWKSIVGLILGATTGAFQLLTKTRQDAQAQLVAGLQAQVISLQSQLTTTLARLQAVEEHAEQRSRRIDELEARLAEQAHEISRLQDYNGILKRVLEDHNIPIPAMQRRDDRS